MRRGLASVGRRFWGFEAGSGSGRSLLPIEPGIHAGKRDTRVGHGRRGGIGLAASLSASSPHHHLRKESICDVSTQRSALRW